MAHSEGVGLAEREGFEPSSGVGNIFKRHATLHTNAPKFQLERVRIALSVSARELT